MLLNITFIFDRSVKYEELKKYICKIRNIHKGEINEQNFVSPHSRKVLKGSLFRWHVPTLPVRLVVSIGDWWDRSLVGVFQSRSARFQSDMNILTPILALVLEFVRSYSYDKTFYQILKRTHWYHWERQYCVWLQGNHRSIATLRWSTWTPEVTRVVGKSHRPS